MRRPSATAELPTRRRGRRARRATGSPPSSRRIPAVAAAHPDAASRLVGAARDRRRPTSRRSVAELDLLRPLIPGRPFLEAEVAWAVRHELALSVDDVLSRRLRLSPEMPIAGTSVAPRVAAIMAARARLERRRVRAASATTTSRPPRANTRCRLPTEAPPGRDRPSSTRHRQPVTVPGHGRPGRLGDVLRHPVRLPRARRDRLGGRRGRPRGRGVASRLVRGGAPSSRADRRGRRARDRDRRAH